MYSFTNKHSKVFGYVSVLFTGLGFTIVSPVLPFLTLPYSPHTSASFLYHFAHVCLCSSCLLICPHSR